MYKVITVDDEKLIKRSIHALILKHQTGFEVVGEAIDGEDALQLCTDLSPDLVITDIRMPKMNGLSFIQKVKENNEHTQFIVVSGYDEFEYAQTALRYGVVDFLLKPIKPNQFLASLQKVHHQLEMKDKASKERSEWLWNVKVFAEELVNHIWLLEDQHVRTKMEEIHQNLLNKQVENQTMKRLYTDLITYMKGELRNQAERMSDLSYIDETTLPDKQENMREFMITLCESIIHTIKGKRNFGHRKNILTAVSYLEEHFTKANVSLQEVSNLVDMSPSYFSMEFKQEMGISFKQYLTKKRMDKAKDLLHNPIYKTYEIAEAIGYGDYPHFTKTFKKSTGLTPTQYRKRIGF
ncbi:response regulator transcription factor [Pontibacillus yanchengensis]|uniref:AraC family transcriptional regulator n=1 Tax=Pontibacillus yanchengensis Y32 TaxID=1385514 RepID=A0A0A2TBV3_9BACI|nr:response regulator [Pontibacillus yanchengensis]KGP71868.1 AraC family transcriptional regulator [Pontibacillus yanchengensis Y32]